MAEKKEIILSTSSVNSYGFRVLTQGIDLKQYKKNPILLWNHNRGWRGTNDEVLPIGKIENLRIEDDKLIGTPVFDQKDEFALKIQSKFEQGIINSCSVGLKKIATSNEKKFIAEGQTSETLTKSKLMEVSMCDIPSNDDCVVLYDDNDEIINLSINQNNNIPKLINMATEVTTNEIILQQKDTEILQLKAERDALLKEKEDAKKLQAKTLVEDALKAGKIPTTKKKVLSN